MTHKVRREGNGHQDAASGNLSHLMTDTAERAVGEAESWLVSAKDKLGLAENDEAAATVCCSLAIHAVIRANDAISLKFLRIKATRHDDAPAMFSKALRQGKIGSENRRFLRLRSPLYLSSAYIATRSFPAL